MSNTNNIKLMAFDLDGTLTQHKSKLEHSNKLVLLELSKKYKLLIVGAGQCMRIFNQMDRFPIDIIGNYGMQGRYNEKLKHLILLRILHCHDEDIERYIFKEKYGYTYFTEIMLNIIHRVV